MGLRNERNVIGVCPYYPTTFSTLLSYYFRTGGLFLLERRELNNESFLNRLIVHILSWSFYWVFYWFCFLQGFVLVQKVQVIYRRYL